MNLTNQLLILVDQKDHFQGYAPTKECHTGQGKRHRAFVTLLFNSQGKVLIQRRKHKLFDGLWDLTAISHPLHLNGRNETYQQASDRALRKEMGIGRVSIEKVGAFNYFAQDGKSCENEYCAILVGNYNGKIRPNKREVYEVKKIDSEKFLDDIGKNPAKYTPWAKLTVKQISSRRLLASRLTANGFKDELAGFLRVFEPYARSYFEKRIKDVSRYPKLIGEFYKDLADFTIGGKKLRAFLIYLGYLIAGGRSARWKFEKILPIALAYELIHSFLLIHDDIIDQSDSRRGKLTIHKRYEKLFGSPTSAKASVGKHYGISQAIILGDIACFEAQDLINSADFDSGEKVVCQKVVVGTMLETGYGEALDIEYANMRPSLGAVWQMIQLKTARYSFVGPLTIGAILGGAGKKQRDSLEQYGLLVGTAFQLHDDILGVFGDEKLLGKSVLSDMREGKNTILFYKAEEMAGIKRKKELEKIWGKKNAGENDLKKARAIFTESGAREWSERESERLVKLGKTYIKQIAEDSKYRQILEELTDFVISRNN